MIDNHPHVSLSWYQWYPAITDISCYLLYRVNVDVDVPLFLPLSGQRRMTDLRYTAQQEKAHGFRINGQVNFESGWEFGFYLSNAVTARAIWNPRMEVRAL
jgi:hypothetical protein